MAYIDVVKLMPKCYFLIMTREGKSIIFWLITIICFSFPFIFYLVNNNDNIVVKLDQKPLKNNYNITVHVSGALDSPGIYKLKPGAKLHQLIEHLNLSENADLSTFNLAKTLRDGQKIKINYKNQSFQQININLASHQDLMSLPGIGTAYAKKIKAFRELNGVIKSIDQLEKLIGKSKVAKIKSKIIL